ncbi:RDD family protein [Glycomyces mayteni]|uniref:RDD family protein n=1 Tax=Glycomyces mayteni TaxID=543887 RepID=A0ABW2D5U3_9ACTN
MTSERGAKTPETTGSGQDLASISLRFLALVIDWVACLLLSYLLQWIGIEAPQVAGADVLPSGLFLLYTAVALAVGTQTLGMALMRIACIDAETGGRLPLWRSILRAVLLSLVLPALTAIFHPYNRGLHDLAAGSVVLKVPAAG